MVCRNPLKSGLMSSPKDRLSGRLDVCLSRNPLKSGLMSSPHEPPPGTVLADRCRNPLKSGLMSSPYNLKGIIRLALQKSQSPQIGADVITSNITSGRISPKLSVAIPSNRG